MMNELPKDPFVLMSFVNTKLRDCYDSLDELCAAMNVDQVQLCSVMQSIGMEYNAKTNKFW